MGRVSDAPKRAEGQPRTSFSETSDNREGSDNVSYFVPRSPGHPSDGSPFTPSLIGFNSASTAHTDEATAGPALLGGHLP